MTQDERKELVRLAKDHERLRLAFEILESLESMVFYRGWDQAPRMRILRMLQDMSTQASDEMDRIDNEV